MFGGWISPRRLLLYFFFFKRNRGTVDLRESGVGGGSGRSEGRRNSSQDVMYERRMKEKREGQRK